jgi:dipicolinate synthase subunit A
MAREQGLFVIDYFDREELAVANAVATAEGAVKLIMEETPITVCGAKCLVIGYGRIGKILSHRLRELGANVTVSARRYSDFQWIRAFGCTPADTGQLRDILGRFDIIVNTVPARLLGEELLRRVRPGALCMDLASKPGGMDFAAASRLGLKAMWALSLPGEIAPETSGENIKNTLYNILSELEVPYGR